MQSFLFTSCSVFPMHKSLPSGHANTDNRQPKYHQFDTTKQTFHTRPAPAPANQPDYKQTRMKTASS